MQALPFSFCATWKEEKTSFGSRNRPTRRCRPTSRGARAANLQCAGLSTDKGKGPLSVRQHVLRTTSGICWSLRHCHLHALPDAACLHNSPDMLCSCRLLGVEHAATFEEVQDARNYLYEVSKHIRHKFHDQACIRILCFGRHFATHYHATHYHLNTCMLHS